MLYLFRADRMDIVTSLCPEKKNRPAPAFPGERKPTLVNLFDDWTEKSPPVLMVMIEKGGRLCPTLACVAQSNTFRRTTRFCGGGEITAVSTHP